MRCIVRIYVVNAFVDSSAYVYCFFNLYLCLEVNGLGLFTNTLHFLVDKVSALVNSNAFFLNSCFCLKVNGLELFASIRMCSLLRCIFCYDVSVFVK
jgi:hypothetical protein